MKSRKARKLNRSFRTRIKVGDLVKINPTRATWSKARGRFVVDFQIAEDDIGIVYELNKSEMFRKSIATVKWQSGKITEMHPRQLERV